MSAPYNLEVFYDCTRCGFRAQRPFCNLQTAAVAGLNEITHTSVYPKGAVLFVEGEPPRGVFILCSGRAKLTALSAEGRVAILDLASAGDLLGLSAAILGQPYEVTAETVEPAQINFVKRADFLRFLSQFSEAGMHSSEQLSRKVRAALDDVRRLGLSQTAAERLARLLLDWHDQSPHRGAQGVRIVPQLTHEELAQLIGATRETVSRQLGHWKRNDVIKMVGTTMYVPDRSKLEAVVG